MVWGNSNKELSALMLILAPVCGHVDTGDVYNFPSWRCRGWCRMELAAALLAVNDLRIVVSQGAGQHAIRRNPTELRRQFACSRLVTGANGQVAGPALEGSWWRWSSATEPLRS